MPFLLTLWIDVDVLVVSLVSLVRSTINTCPRYRNRKNSCAENSNLLPDDDSIIEIMQLSLGVSLLPGQLCSITSLISSPSTSILEYRPLPPGSSHNLYCSKPFSCGALANLRNSSQRPVDSVAALALVSTIAKIGNANNIFEIFHCFIMPPSFPFAMSGAHHRRHPLECHRIPAHQRVGQPRLRGRR